MMGLVAVLALLCLGSAAGAEQVSAFVTGLKFQGGSVEVRKAADLTWMRAAPLMALNAGDTIRATGTASAVLVLAGGRAPLTVTAGTSPVIVPGAAPESKLDKVATLLVNSFEFLKARAKPPDYRVLGARGSKETLALVSPRAGLVLPGTPIIFEWSGPNAEGYALRVSSPTMVILERERLTQTVLAYDVRAQPGTEYRWQVAAAGVTRSAAFRMATERESREMRDALAALDAAWPGTSDAALLKATTLLRSGYYYDARRVLLGGIRRDPDDPTLHILMGDLLLAIDLPWLAADAYAEADALQAPQRR